MKVSLIRNATLVISVNDKKILVDPMLGEKGVLGKFPWTDDARLNPLVDLPFSELELNNLIGQIDAVLLTHLHPDHWDFKAHQLIPKNMPIYCQSEDTPMIEGLGFNNIIPVAEKSVFSGIEIYRTEGKHGLGEVGGLMGKVSGFILRHNEETLYVAGDTVWCDDVINAIDKFKPTFIIVNGGSAKFNVGEHVTMNVSDIKELLNYYTNHKIAVVHLETVSPTVENREYILNFLSVNNILERVIIPKDGEEFHV